MSEKKLIFTIPMRTVSEANISEHWTKKSKRHQAQQMLVRLGFRGILQEIYLPCVVTITRMGSKFLDREDNLPMSLKWIKDQVADCLIPGLAKGRADDDDRISWKLNQEKAKSYSVRIEIEFSSPNNDQ